MNPLTYFRRLCLASNGSETWKQTKKKYNDLQVFVNKCLRQILQIRWPKKISNSELWIRTGPSSITNTIKKWKWGWIGHILRRTKSNITRQALDWKHQSKIKRDRPTTTWIRTITMSWKLQHHQDRCKKSSHEPTQMENCRRCPLPHKGGNRIRSGRSGLA